MKRVFLLTLTVSIISTQTFSQAGKIKKLAVYAGAQTSIAVGDLAKTQGVGIGANLLVTNKVSNKIDVTGRVHYTYLFGKKHSTSYYEPGGTGGSHSGHYKGMNDLGITIGGRGHFGNNLFGGVEGGLCHESIDGHSHTSGLIGGEGGYEFQCGSMWQMIALYFGICGDPQVQIGIRYGIRL